MLESVAHHGNQHVHGDHYHGDVVDCKQQLSRVLGHLKSIIRLKTGQLRQAKQGPEQLAQTSFNSTGYGKQTIRIRTLINAIAWYKHNPVPAPRPPLTPHDMYVLSLCFYFSLVFTRFVLESWFLTRFLALLL